MAALFEKSERGVMRSVIGAKQRRRLLQRSKTRLNVQSRARSVPESAWLKSVTSQVMSIMRGASRSAAKIACMYCRKKPLW
jgi:hypothetical protein